MKIKLILFVVFLVLATEFLNAQSFINGDLEGMVSGYSTVPPSWQVVSHLDINCHADSVGVSPDLINLSLPDSSWGVIGSPYSGNSFAAGSHGIDSASGITFHEGIMQELVGFTIGEEYSINFYQSVVKSLGTIDTSGSWMVILDDSILCITAPTISQEPFYSTSFSWESRSISFYATQTSHTIKFLPIDDDNNLLSSTSNLNGGLYMGIDSIRSYLKNTFSGKLLV